MPVQAVVIAARAGAQVAGRTAAKVGSKIAQKGAQKGAQAGARAASKGAQKGSRAAARGTAKAGKGAANKRGPGDLRPGGRPPTRPGPSRTGGSARSKLDRARQQVGRGRSVANSASQAAKGDVAGQAAHVAGQISRFAARRVLHTAFRGLVKKKKKQKAQTDDAEKAKKRNRRILIIVVMTVVFFLLMPMMSAMAVFEMNGRGRVQQGQEAGTNGVAGGCAGAAQAVADATHIPLDATEAYCAAAGGVGVDWAILAGIGKAECDHGRSQLAGCNPRGTINGAGARGPMQFLGSTWRASAGTFDLDVAGPAIPEGQEGSGYASDGDGDGIADPWMWFDATFGAARLLKANGVAQDPSRALRAYNNSDSYVRDVLDYADEYRAAGGVGGALPTTGTGFIMGSTERYTESRITPTTQRMLDTVVPLFGRASGIGCFRNGTSGEHPLGRACDFMQGQLNRTPTPEGVRHGDQFAGFLVQNATVLRVRYVIWKQHIWQASAPYWRLMEDRGSLQQNHFDHVHVSMEAEP